MAKPFLKWAGGKRQLIGELHPRLPPSIADLKTYCEPFLGGGAFLFHMLTEFNFDEVHASDINPELILCYKRIKQTPSKVFDHLHNLISDYPPSNPTRDEFYYDVRNSWNSNLDISSMNDNQKNERTAQTLFMNKTCFNGLFRLNQKGEFNVPTGRYTKPAFPTEEKLQEVSEAIQNVQFHLHSYENILNYVDEDAFVYFDPPYRPISKTSSANIYTKNDFDDSEQIRLAKFTNTLNEKGVKFLLSNSDPKNFTNTDDFFDELYAGFNIQRIQANRAINSNPNSRGAISELLISNY